MSRAGFARTLFYSACLTWPWCVYEMLPGTSLTWSAVCLAGITLHAITTLPHYGKLRVPWELIWPVVAAAALVTWLAPASLPAVLLGAAGFWAMIHLYGDGRVWCQGAMLLACGAAIATVVHATHGLLGLPPTVILPGFSLELAFPHSVTEALFVWTGSALLGAGVVVHPAAGRWQRIVAMVATLIVLAGLFMATPDLLHLARGTTLTTWSELPAAAMVARLLIVWLLARVAGKALVRAWTDKTAAAVLAGIAPIAGALMVLCGAHVTGVGLALPLALMARAGMRVKDRLPKLSLQERIAATATVLLLLAMFSYNTLYVSPGNGADPRNYAARAERAEASGDLATVKPLLKAVIARNPGEARAALWLGRVALATGHPDHAAEYVAEMTQRSEGTILPPPTDREVEDFLTELRDGISLSEEISGLAYERALVAAGDPEDALALLRLRKPHPLGIAIDKAVLVTLLTNLLGSEKMEESLERFSAEQLAGVVVAIGADIRRAPEGFPAHLLPVVAWLRPDPDSLTLHARAGAHTFGVSLPGPESHIPGWGPLTQDPTQGWLLPQAGPPHRALQLSDGARIVDVPEERRLGAHEALSPPGSYGIVILLP